MSNRIILFTIEDMFQISGRGLILVPGLGIHSGKVKIGDTILLKKPDNTEILTKIAGIELGIKAAILLPANITKKEVPVGTEVCLENKLSK